MQINKKLQKGKWIKYKGEVEFLIRPYSVFATKLTPSEMQKELTLEQMFDMFEYMVINWKGVNDENEKLLPCDEENKKLVYELFGEDIIGIIFEEASKLRNEIKGIKEKPAKN